MTRLFEFPVLSGPLKVFLVLVAVCLPAILRAQTQADVLHIPKSFSLIQKSVVGIRFTQQGVAGKVTLTGVAVSNDGYIVTAATSLKRGDQITVQGQGGAALNADFIASDASTGIALIRVKGATMGYSALAGRTFTDEQAVYAMGSLMPPSGGSGTDRNVVILAGTLKESANSMDQLMLLETRIPFVPELLGRPLVSEDQTLAGLITGSFASSAGPLAFAIRWDQVVNVVEDLRASGRVRRGWLGANVVPHVWPASEAMSPGRFDVDIASVVPGSPASRVGLQPGDQLAMVDAGEGQWKRFSSNTKPFDEPFIESWRRASGDILHLKFVRAGDWYAADVALADIPEGVAQPVYPIDKTERFIGLIKCETPSQDDLKKRSYPLQAVRDHIEGDVLILFDVHRRGPNSNFRVMRSDNPILNEAALFMARSLKCVTDSNTATVEQTFSFKIPD